MITVLCTCTPVHVHLWQPSSARQPLACRITYRVPGKQSCTRRPCTSGQRSATFRALYLQLYLTHSREQLQFCIVCDVTNMGLVQDSSNKKNTAACHAYFANLQLRMPTLDPSNSSLTLDNQVVCLHGQYARVDQGIIRHRWTLIEAQRVHLKHTVHLCKDNPSRLRNRYLSMHRKASEQKLMDSIIIHRVMGSSSSSWGWRWEVICLHCRKRKMCECSVKRRTVSRCCRYRAAKRFCSLCRLRVASLHPSVLASALASL